MAQENETLPEGTDQIINGAFNEREEELIVSDPTSTTTTSTTDTATPGPDASRREQAVDKLRTSTANLTDQAADKARGLVGQGLEKGSEALANVSKMIGDTASGIDERLGAEYGNYARKAATTLDDVANKLATKDADELISDTRNFVARSPGIALAGAAVVGFAIARLFKVGLDRDPKRDS